jgi:CHAT domain-containing protein/tetratricopeptide (TPR) repeat protein
MRHKSFATRLFVACFWCFVSVWSPHPSLAQDKPNNAPNRPAQLIAADPEIRALLDNSTATCDQASADQRFGRLQTAVSLADKRGLVGDRALAEAFLASAQIGRGDLDLGFTTARKALQDSIDAKNEVLEADILLSLAGDAQIKGRSLDAVGLVSQALKIAEKAGSLYEKARALGELGKLQLGQGKTSEAAKSIDEALNIDKINGYQLEAIHLVYQGIYLGMTGRVDEALASLSQARTKAVAAKDPFSFISAEGTYAIGLVNKARVDEAIEEMTFLKSGSLQAFIPDAREQACMAFALQSPMFHLTVLEDLTYVLGAANQKAKELEVWKEVYSYSRDHNVLAGAAEAAQKVADLDNQLKNTDDSLKYYAIAIELFRRLQNETNLTQVEVAQSPLLEQVGRGREALPLIGDVSEYAKRHNLRPLEFGAYLETAQIYYTNGDLDSARKVVEAAESMIRPGPYDSEIGNQGVMGLYGRLADIYKALGIPTRELIMIDKEFFVAVHLNDEKSQQLLVSYLDQRLRDLRIRELVEQRQKEGRLSESLLFSYVLYLRDGVPAKPTDDHSNWQRITSLPFEIVAAPGGAKTLVDILDQIGSLFGIEKLSVLDALARYYVGAGDDPVMAEKYAIEAETVLSNATTDVSALKVESSCVLAVAYSRQAKKEQSTKRMAECLSLAKQTNDSQTIRYAQAAVGMAQLYGGGDLSSAKESLEALSKAAPEETALHVQLAMSLAKEKLYDQAHSELERAVATFLSNGETKSAAEAYVVVSRALNPDSSERAQSLQLKYLTSSLKMYQEIKANAEQASVLNDFGDYFLKVSLASQAIESYAKAYDLAESVKRADVAAQAQFGLANSYQALKDLQRANECYKSAAIRYHSLANAGLETISLNALANNYATLGDADTALSTFLEAKNISHNSSDKYTYIVDQSLGTFYRSHGQLENSVQVLKEAVDLATRFGDLQQCAYSHLAIAISDQFVGEWEEALSEIETARRQFEQVNDRHGEALSWSQLVSVYSERESPLKDFEKAQECYAKAKELDPGTVSHFDLTEIYLQTGRYSEAATAALEGIRSCAKQGYIECQAHGLLSLAEAKWSIGDLQGARLVFNQASSLVAKSPDLYLGGRLLYVKARLLVRENRPNEALAAYKELIALIEQVKTRLSDKDQRSLSETYGYIYDELVALLYSMGTKDSPNQSRLASEAFEYAEINKARQFSESWGRVFVGRMKATLPADLRENERKLFSRRDRLVAQLDVSSNSTRQIDPTDKQHLEADLSSTQDEIHSLLKQLRQVAPQYAAIAYPEPVQMSQLPLRPGETVVEFKMTDDATFVWIIHGQGGSRNHLISFYKVSRPRAWFVDRVSILRKALNSGRVGTVDWKIADELFADLFPRDISKAIIDSQEVTFIPDDVLFVLPFELLSPTASAGKFVFLTKPTTYYPSASALRLSRAASHRPKWENAFLGVADPITSPADNRFEVATALRPAVHGPSKRDEGDRPGKEVQPPGSDALKARGFSFERLPGTAVEVESIAALLRTGGQSVDIREGVTATKDAVLDTDLSRFRFVHFATHGVLPVDTGVTEPSLVLSYDGVAPSHMFLSMSEILDLKLSSESVVLSACNTGSGKISRAEGVMSLGRAFLAAGSSSVTVSLWQVSDESTALLMRRYYQSLLDGKRKNIALAEARNAVFMSGQTDPFFWAPFIVIGE